MLSPPPCQGTREKIKTIPGYEWIENLPKKKIYFSLFQNWQTNCNLPIGYDYYIVSFHLEAVDLDWLRKQQVSGPIIVLFDGQSYNVTIPGVHFVPFFYWHYQFDQMINWFGVQLPQQQRNYKFSAVCNRITQSKIWITTKILETAKSCSLIALNSWLQEKNVHDWQVTGNPKLDQLTQIFQNKYLGQTIKIDNFDNDTQNNQKITGNPWQPLYQDCAVHFTNESFHYSFMQENNHEYIWPGPFITEKTLKCLLGGTAFIPVGQFETYKTLENLGFVFDYEFETNWDCDSSNLNRFCSIVELIDRLNQFDVNQLMCFTKLSNEHNQQHIISGKFFETCQEKNLESIERINQLLS